MAAPSFVYQVTQANPTEVVDDLCRLWSSNLHLDVPAPNRFSWLYRDAPDASDVVFLLEAKPTDAALERVGTLGLAVRTFHVNGRRVRAAINGNLAVDQSHRGLLPALKLVRAARDHSFEDFSISYGFPNSKAEGVMLRAGFKLLAKTSRWVRVLEHAGYLPRLKEDKRLPPMAAAFVSSPLASKLIGPAIDVGKIGRGAMGIAKAAVEYRLEYPGHIDARFDVLWNAARTEYGVVGARTAKLLSWRYPEADVATLVSRRDNKVVAYAIIERDRSTNAAHLRDVFGHKGALGALMDLLIPRLRLAGFTSVSVRFVGADHFREVIAARDFTERGEHRTVIVQAGKHEDEQTRATIEDARSWHMFDLDEDM